MKELRIDNAFGDLMVIVPHEDDELLMTAGVLKSASNLGLSARVVMVTNGDYDFEDREKGLARLPETLAGLAELGIFSDSVTFLGYADTGMPQEESFLSRLYASRDENRIFPGHCSRETYSLPEKPEHHRVRYGEPAAYCRKHLAADLLDCVEAVMPRNIFTTSLYDTHGDHSGLFRFVLDAVRQTVRRHPGYCPRIFSGIVHSLAGDDVWPPLTGESTAFPMPPGFEETCPLKWEDRICFPVPDPDLKRRALSKHVTALKPDAVDFLYSFVRREELFWEITADSFMPKES